MHLHVAGSTRGQIAELLEALDVFRNVDVGASPRSGETHFGARMNVVQVNSSSRSLGEWSELRDSVVSGRST
jgi:hypothetical protein